MVKRSRGRHPGEAEIGGKKLGEGGFTLTELALATLIIGILMSMGIGILRMSMERVSLEVTKTRLGHIQEVMVHFLRQNKHLPCPDVFDDGNYDGQEDRDESDACINPRGILPYADLGLDRNEVVDGWNNFFTYHISNKSSGSGDDWTKAQLLTENSSITETSLLTQSSVGELTVSGAPGRVFVIISHGPNGDGALTADGYQNTLPPSGTDEGENANGDRVYVDANHSNTYDDILTSMSPTGLLTPLIKDGTAASQEKMLALQFSEIRRVFYGYFVKNNSKYPPNCNLPGNLSDLSPWSFDPWNKELSYIPDPLSDVLLTVTATGPDPDFIMSITKEEVRGLLASAKIPVSPCVDNGYAVIADQFKKIRYTVMGYMLRNFFGDTCVLPSALDDPSLGLELTDPWKRELDYIAPPITIPDDPLLAGKDLVCKVTSTVGGIDHVLEIDRNEVILYYGNVGIKTPNCIQSNQNPP